MEYTDSELQAHELHFWTTQWHAEWDAFAEKRFKTYYNPFFDFSSMKEPILEVGCAGIPASSYFPLRATLIDPLLKDLLHVTRFSKIGQGNTVISESFITAILPKNEFNSVLCFNCLDHFNNAETLFFAKTHSVLKPAGRLYLYYHLREYGKDDHLALDQSAINKEIAKYFTVIKYSEEMEPEVIGWASGCRRYILEKKLIDPQLKSSSMGAN